MSETFVGSAFRRVEDPRLVRGDGRYVSDVSVEGMLRAVVVRSTEAHALIRSIDTAAARAMPGVVAVFTAGDLGSAQRPIGTFGQFPQSLIERWKPVIRKAPVYPLAAEKVRYAGEPVAVVVAADQYTAEDAAAAVVVDYEPLPAVTDVEKAIVPGSATLFEGWEENTALHMRVTVGDAGAAFASAAHVVKERFRSQRYTGMPLEGRGMLVVPEPAGRGMTVWTSHQLPHFQRQTICEALEIPEFEVRVAQADIGGGFGPKAGLYPEDVLIPFAAHLLGRPVKWLEDRREHIMASSHSREQLFDAEAAFDADGRFLGIRYRVLIDAGAYLTFPVVLPYLGLCHFLGPYRVPALDAEIRSVLTNKSTSAPYRGAGRPETVFVLNRLLDQAARDLGLDTVEIRRRNLIPAAEMPYSPGILYRDGNPMMLDSGDYPEMFEKAVAAIGYDGFRRTQAEARERGEHLGIGFVCNIEATGIGPFEGARVQVDPSGQVAVYTGVVNTGQGHSTVFAQVCADSLGVHPDAVSVITGDTGTVGFSRGTYHSRAAVAAGNAVHMASQKVRRKLIDLAAHHLEADSRDIELAGGQARVKGSPGRALSLGRLAQLCIPGGNLPEGMTPGVDETDYYTIPTVTWANAAHAVIVSVDPGTGRIKIVKYVVVHDCGNLLNPLIAEGQIHGGVAAGIGGAIFEELVYGSDGQPRTTTLMDYLLPRLGDVPVIEVLHMESPTPLNPLGVKGAGEGGTIGPPAAIAAAVEDALAGHGVRINSTPVSPGAILEAIAAASLKPAATA